MKLSKKKLLELRKKNKKIKSKKIIKGTSEKPRLAIYRSNQNIYAQLIDDIKNVTLVSCSTLDRSMKESISVGKTIDASHLIGKKLAELSLKKNIKTVIFDRGPYLYHGRIKALAEGARDGGLQF